MHEQTVNHVHTPTKPLTKRQRRRAERTEEILDAAMRVIERDGVEDLTIAKVAREADAAVGALYRYFAGKDELLAALQQRAVVRYGEFVREATDQDLLDPLQALRAMVRSWFRFASEEPHLHELIDSSMSHPTPTLSTDAALLVDQTVREQVFSVVFDLLEAAAAEGLLSSGDREVRALALWAVAHGTYHFRKRDRLSARPVSDRVCDELVEALIAHWTVA